MHGCARPGFAPAFMTSEVNGQAIRDAARRLMGIVVETPLLRHDLLDEMAGAQVYLKCENLQVTGSFKIRGAVNRLSLIASSQRPNGVVAFSSGNHAQGVARAARAFGIPATIVMPKDAPAIKIEGVKRDGAHLMLYDRATQSRESIAGEIAEETGACLVPSFDDPMIVAGQGTLGLEVAQQMRQLGRNVDHMIVCTGGGGLISGSALALHQTFPDAQVWCAEPEGFDDWRRSLAVGERVSNPPGRDSICDAILTPRPGRIPFELALEHIAGGLCASELEVCRAMAFAFRNLKLVLEPGGAVALAAAVRGLPKEMHAKTVVIVLTGGNVDRAVFSAALSRADDL